MQQKFLHHIDNKFPFLKGKKLLIAISGGVDSVVLTHLLSKLNFTIALAHCNFKLRDTESNLDEEFVKKIGKLLNIKTFTTRFETEKFAAKNKQSTQIAARNLRYSWFKEIAEKHQFNYVLTAHHADDNLETFLINLSRGTGLEGLTGIPDVNGNIVRPLLTFSRDEIISFAKKNNIYWREDKSNASIKYIRNKIRHKVVPVLKEINPSLLESFAKTTAHLEESQQILEDRISEVSKNIIQKDFSCGQDLVKFNIKKINQLSNPKAYLYRFLKEYNFTEWNDVYNLLSAQSGKQVFSKTHILLKDRDFLILSKKTDNTNLKEVEIIENQLEIKYPIHITFKIVKDCSLKNKATIYVNREAISFPLKLRKWVEGDVFYPSNMKGKKKLSKYFKDEKLSLFQKENTWLLCDKHNNILWIVGLRQDNRYLAKKDTTKILKISFIP
ncbi:tRNA lysidine(34) synthetase TilS [Polaribacter aquimarinus]|uniref:tRNA(Ile)-lysidine synthase n=1 Tax=Polaribacter aquimarinus TaxID=2100726 RepID=A0A2U2JCN6_9FLAO|nr:tRNA lysidine(34) synthetase TilS [Polaribacter aquimarinus]PWG06113.1 tRNA lysidine(34) synthetase TilS [Polaribacter aquimarinus]